MQNTSPAPTLSRMLKVEAVLGEVVARTAGGPPGHTIASGQQLAAALDAAGWRAVRDAVHRAQLRLKL